MKIYFEHRITSEERRTLLRRPGQSQKDTIDIVTNMCRDIKHRGDEAVREYGKKFDQADVQQLRVSAQEIEAAKNSMPSEFITALSVAINNIRKFHSAQRSVSRHISTMQGVECWREVRSIESVGLYIPAGSAPLPSTVLMLGIPAKLAGCKHIVLCSPPKAEGSVDPYVLAAAEAIGIDEIYKVGGVQAIAAMAYGTETIPKVDKIFGPGNRFVTAAKQFISTDGDGTAIDLLAGPSEVLVLADESADPDVVVYDLLSQAEHDADAQVILITTNEKLAKSVQSHIARRVTEFSRRKVIESSLEHGYILVVESQKSAIQFANEYAPEHLIINMEQAEEIVPFILNAGSVFVGSFAPVTAGDYASGTNHTLPTSGTAKWTSGVSLESFQKIISFQSITKLGLERLSPTLMQFAHAEGLFAHAQAVLSRLSGK
jgi:histidinol dehydrogenase